MMIFSGGFCDSEAVILVSLAEIVNAHGPMGAEKIGDKNGNDGFAIVSSGRKVV